MTLSKCPKCNREFIKTNDKCIYCGYDMNSNDINDEFFVSGNKLIRYQGVNKNIVIPNGILEIGNNAFMNNEYIETVKFSNSVRIIGESAFENCIHLFKLINNNNIEYYKKNSFKNTGLIELEFSENTIDIGECAFFGNDNLVKIIYKPNKNIFLKRSFAKCSKLIDVIIDKKYFFPSFGPYERGDGRPTFYDAFWNTPYKEKMALEYNEIVKKGKCPDCGGKLTGILSKKCVNCGIYLRRLIWR